MGETTNGNAVDCVSSLASGGEVRVQLLYALGTTSTPPSGGAARYNFEQRGGNSGRPPLGGIVRYHPRPLGQGAKSGGPGASLPILCG